jgi:pimeloyl-ACP methyl ester carboxylesterase
MDTLPTERPSLMVPSRDGTPIAVFRSGAIAGAVRPLVLVHGTSADHRTWRVAAPLLAPRFDLWAMDRRGRGDSGDAPNPADWSIERELEDLAAVAEAAAVAAGEPVDVLGHSLGGRIALAATALTPAIRRVIAYESAPGLRWADSADSAAGDLALRLRVHLDAGDLDGLLATFMTEAVGMPAADLAAFRANPIWPLRAAAGPTIVRELEAVRSAPAIGFDALARVTIPVLQLVGSASPPWFRDGAAALNTRLADGRLEVIAGARHAAHHSHAPELVARVSAFLLG